MHKQFGTVHIAMWITWIRVDRSTYSERYWRRICQYKYMKSWADLRIRLKQGVLMVRRYDTETHRSGPSFMGNQTSSCVSLKTLHGSTGLMCLDFKINKICGVDEKRNAHAAQTISWINVYINNMYETYVVTFKIFKVSQPLRYKSQLYVYKGKMFQAFQA